MNKAMSYIEENLSNKIDLKEVAKLACCSTYHFPRMFSSIAGISLSEYIRRRRLSLAAFELQSTNIRVIDVALKYGYDSPDSFARAFYNLHGVKPTVARSRGIQLKAYPKMSFQITIKGETEMEYRIEELDFECSIVGIKEPVVTEDAFKIIPELWRKASENGLLEKLMDMSWENPKCKLAGILGICGEQASITDPKFNYLMGVRYDNPNIAGMEKMIIPKSTWAVFPNVVEAWKRLYIEWLPTSGYDLEDLPCIECYYVPGHSPEEELWVPIKINRSYIKSVNNPTFGGANNERVNGICDRQI